MDIKNTLVSVMVAALLCGGAEMAPGAQSGYPIQPVPFTCVKVTDAFWRPKIETNKKVTIPIALAQNEKTGRVRNFKIAAGLEQGPFQSIFPFDDTDIYKMIEAASYSLQTTPDPALEAKLDSLIAWIGMAQEEDGYLYTNRTIADINGTTPHEWAGAKRWELDHFLSHELYNAGHLFEAAVAHHQATGKNNLLTIAIKTADLLDRTFGWDKLHQYPGHQVVEMGTVKLSLATGEKRYLDLAKFFLDVRGPGGEEYCQAHKKVVDQSEAVGHAVRATYMYSGMADIAAIFADESYLRASRAIWQDMVYRKTYITGGIGASGNNEGFDIPYNLPNLDAYCETCASVGNIFWNYRMFLHDGESRYIDVMEKTLYNAFLSGVSLSGDRFFYPNVLESNGKHQRREWFGCACCPPNLARLLPSLPGYVYATMDSAIYVNLYLANTARFSYQERPITVSQHTRYPWDGQVEITVAPAQPAAFTLMLRIPGWAQNEAIPGDLYRFIDLATPVSIMINGQKVDYEMKKGYAAINRLWRAGDIVTIDFPMAPRKVVSSDSLKGNRGKMAIQRGPIMYAAEWPERKEGRVLNLVFAKGQSLKSSFVPALLNGVTVVEAEARAARYTVDGRVNLGGAEKIRLIPYYAWNNRGPGEMMVWLPYDCDRARPSYNSLGKSGEAHRPVPFTAVHVNDAFWAPKIETNRTVSIPSAFKQCELNGRIDNYALAGGKIIGEHKGDFPFDDTDVYKVIEGAAYALAVQYDEKLDGYVDSLITLISAAQEPDGYLYTCLTNKCDRLKRWYGKGRWDRLNSHELYNCGHLYEAAVAHFQATGKRNLLHVAIKNADLVDQVFGPAAGQKKVPSGHPIIEMALVKLYRVTGEERYLRLAKFFIDETGRGSDGHKLSAYSQDHEPIREQEEAVGHAVRLGYLYAGVTDVAYLLGDAALLDASKRVWKNVVAKKLYLTGGIGSRAQGEGFGPDYELNNMTAYCETCASIANVYWNYRLYLSDPDAIYYDVLERTLYNGVIAGVSLKGDTYFYDNPLESDGSHARAPWFGCACCPGNVTRFMASIPGYIYTASDQAIAVNLFIGNDARIAVGRDTVVLALSTQYPWDGKIAIKFLRSAENPVDLMVRIPGWSRGQAVPSDLYRFVDADFQPPEVILNGAPGHAKIVKGYAHFRRNWQPGDVLEVTFPMPVCKVVTQQKVAFDRGKLALQRGPVVYCFEDKDHDGQWMFDHFIPDQEPAAHQFEPELLGGVVSLSLTGHKINKQGDVEAAPMKAIPYYAWNNRGKASMLVWMPQSAADVHTRAGQGLEAGAAVSSSIGWVTGLNEGFTPRHSADVDKLYQYFWLKKGTAEWVQYDFDEPQLLSESSVYWLNLEHYDGDYRAPESWNLMVKDAQEQWQPVKTNDAYGIALDRFNNVRFAPAFTKSIRLNVQLQKEASGGILEWRVR